MMLPVSLSAFQALRNNVTMLWRPLFYNKKLLKSLSVSGSATRKSSQPFSILTSQFSDNVMRLSVLFYTFEA
jgi:hypothetical protein